MLTIILEDTSNGFKVSDEDTAYCQAVGLPTEIEVCQLAKFIVDASRYGTGAYVLFATQAE